MSGSSAAIFAALMVLVAAATLAIAGEFSTNTRLIIFVPVAVVGSLVIGAACGIADAERSP